MLQNHLQPLRIMLVHEQYVLDLEHVRCSEYTPSSVLQTQEMHEYWADLDSVSFLFINNIHIISHHHCWHNVNQVGQDRMTRCWCGLI